MTKAKHWVAPALATALIMGAMGASVADVSAAQATAPGQVKKAVYDPSGTPAFVTGTLSAKQSKKDAAAAISVLAGHKEFFKIKNPEASLKEKGAETDALGMTHVRLQQTKDGLPVEGAELLVHFDQEGVVQTVNGHFDTVVDNAQLDTSANLTADEALAAAKRAVNAPDMLDYAPTAEKVVYPLAGQAHVVYKVNVNFLGEQPGNWFVYVDAKTGEVVDQINAILDLDMHPAHATGTGVLGEQRHLQVSRANEKGDAEGSMFYLADYTHPNLEGILTYDFKNQWRSATVQLPGELFADKDASWKDDYQRAGVDAHYNSEKVYEYYLNEHNRNSLDGNGMAIISSVHYGVDYNNAFWNGYQMTYGDGDGKFFIPLSAGLDVAAHEMTHGVINHSAGLLYRNQSGALNEAFADIFGALVDSDDWEMGDNIMAPEAVAGGRTALRSLEDPNKFPVNAAYVPYGNGSGVYPKHMDEFYHLPISLDSGGVHVNSSIINHTAYQIGMEIGREKLGQIFYRTLTVYLTANSNFRDARIATIQAATDLYGADSAETAAVIRGYDSTGITE